MWVPVCTSVKYGRCFSMYDRSVARIVRLNHSSYPLVWGLYVVLNTLLVFQMWQKACKSFVVNWDSVSESGLVRGPSLKIQFLTHSLATSPADITFMGIGFTSFVNRSVSMYLWRHGLRIRSTSMSMGTDYNGAVVGKRSIVPILQSSVMRFWAPSVQCHTMP